jgi:hypothetical protein
LDTDKVYPSDAIEVTKSSTKSHITHKQHYKQASYALDSVGANTKEVFWLPGVNSEYNKKTRTQTM